MSLESDYYEALTWKALQIAYSAPVVYEPSRETHSCELHCFYRSICTKPQVHTRLIHTIPDFLVQQEPPLFVHVCYWDSQESSHAKFWRTISEIGELKCFVPNAESMCIIFKSSYSNGEYSSSGWYSEFLKALHLVFDKAVFFDHDNLFNEINLVERRLPRKRGTSLIYEEICHHSNDYQSLIPLSQEIYNSTHPSPHIQAEIRNIWSLERNLCSSIHPYISITHSGEKLRNAMLQIILIMGMFEKSCSEIINFLEILASRSRTDFPNRDRIVTGMSKIPISNRNKEFQFLAINLQRGIVGPIHCQLSEDLFWLINSIKNEIFSLPINLLIRAIESTYSDFISSSQVQENLEVIKEFINSTNQGFSSFSAWTVQDWIDSYENISLQQSYNYCGEILIEAVGLGTYPLVRKLTELSPDEPVTRNDLRSLYSNRRSTRTIQKQRALIEKLVELIPDDCDWQGLGYSYLHRKAGRIVGPQSATNPLEHL